MSEFCIKKINDVKFLKDKIMKRMVIFIAVLTVFAVTSIADDRPATFAQLPQTAQAFINTNYPGEKVSFVTVDDDLIMPDYRVVMANGVMIQFEHNGKLEKIETRKGEIPAGVVPVQIVELVKAYYPDATILQYEVGRKTYEVKLSNRMELKFNSRFNVIEVDD